MWIRRALSKAGGELRRPAFVHLACAALAETPGYHRALLAIDQGLSLLSSGLLAFTLVSGTVVAFCQNPDTGRPGDELARGRRLFESQCARCHGLKGTGGTGPGLNRARLRRADDDKALIELIKEGAPGTEMPATWQMDDREIRQVAVYVRSLGRAEVTPLPGDSNKGKALYATADCSRCHTLSGHGGGLGPDLTEVGARRGAAHLRQTLIDPGSSKLLDGDGFFAFLNVLVATHDGRVVQGLRVNEDSFTIQIRDAENRLHSFEKRDLAELKREPAASVMPGYAQALTAAQVDDLVAYLSGLRGDR
jgi:putative heme-binding domain-containing protein